MIYFIGAGPGAADLITLRGMRLLQAASLVIYAGSLVNPELLDYCPASCEKLNSASMTLEQVVSALKAHRDDETVIRLHTGDPSFYGAVREQMDLLDREGLAYEVVLERRPQCAVSREEGRRTASATWEAWSGDSCIRNTLCFRQSQESSHTESKLSHIETKLYITLGHTLFSLLRCGYFLHNKVCNSGDEFQNLHVTGVFSNEMESYM